MKRVERRHLLLILAVVVLIGGTITVTQQWAKRGCDAMLDMAFRLVSPPKLEELSSLELKALRLWSVKVGTSPRAAIQRRDVRAFSVGEGTCVALLLKRGDLGGSPVYCFDKVGTLIHRFDQIE